MSTNSYPGTYAHSSHKKKKGRVSEKSLTNWKIITIRRVSRIKHSHYEIGSTETCTIDDSEDVEQDDAPDLLGSKENSRPQPTLTRGLGAQPKPRPPTKRSESLVFDEGEPNWLLLFHSAALELISYRKRNLGRTNRRLLTRKRISIQRAPSDSVSSPRFVDREGTGGENSGSGEMRDDGGLRRPNPSGGGSSRVHRLDPPAKGWKVFAGSR